MTTVELVAAQMSIALKRQSSVAVAAYKILKRFAIISLGLIIIIYTIYYTLLIY